MKTIGKGKAAHQSLALDEMEVSMQMLPVSEVFSKRLFEATNEMYKTKNNDERN